MIEVGPKKIEKNYLLYNVELPFIKFIQSQTWRMSHMLKGDVQSRRSYDYNAVVAGNKSPPKISIVIPVYGRHKHLEQSTKCLIEQIVRLGVEDKINIVVSEMSSHPEHEQYCGAAGVDYVHIPAEYFNKSLAMNLAAASAPAESFIFYDVDLVVGKDWIERCLATVELLEDSGDSCYVVQPISQRKISYVSAELTHQIFDGSKSVEDLKNEDHLIQPEWYKGNYPPGGAVLVSANLFYAVQGYDSSLYWGYSPEDKFFLERCIKYSSKGDILVWDKHEGSDTTVYHMFHENSEHSNISYEHMVVVADVMKNVESIASWYSQDKLRWNQVSRITLSQVLSNGGDRFPEQSKSFVDEIQKIWTSTNNPDMFRVEADKVINEKYSFLKDANPALHKVYVGYVEYIKSRVPDFFDIFVNK